MTKPIKISERERIAIALCASVIILLGLGVYANYRTIRYKDSMGDVNLSGIVITQSQDVLNNIRDIQSAYRGFLMTNDSVYMTSLDISNRLLKTRIAYLKKMPLEREQMLRLDSIELYANDQRTFAYTIIDKRKNVSLAEAWRFLGSGGESELINRLRYQVYNFLNAEKNQQSSKLKRENNSFNKVIAVVTISVIISVVIILLTLRYILKIYQRLTNAEHLLLASQRKLETILDELPVGVIVVDINRRSFHSNLKAKTLLEKNASSDGYLFESGGDAPGYTLNQEFCDKLFITHAINGQATIGFNETMMNVGGQEIPFRVSAIPVYDEAGVPEYAISVFDDISNIKQFESELIEAKKLVEDSLRLKESFLSNMSHEIRTPINAILGFAELLGRRNLGVEENEYVQTISHAGESLLRLLNDILDFSKLESNMMVFEEHPISIDGILNSICVLYSAAANGKGLVLDYECDENVPEIVAGDPVRLTQVLTNIVGNAIKFTPKGSVLIFARKINENEEKTIIEFQVRDSGIGIEKEKIEKVFRRFEQASSATSRLYGGTGLGLSIAKHIIQSQGGEIFVTSEVGIGSVFKFTFPFSHMDASKQEQPQGREPIKDLSFLKGLRLLLVEDNKLNIKLIMGVFKDTQALIDVSETGLAAIKKVQQTVYDIILMDIELPDMSGYDVARLLRGEVKCTTPIIALTAHVLGGEKDKCIAAGMNEYLTKPVNTRLLFERIKVLTDSNDITPPETVPNEGSAQATGIVSAGIDLSYLKELSDNNREFEKEVIEIFLSEAPGQLGALEQAIDVKDYENVKAIAHKLKSSATVMLGMTLRPDFELLEKSAGGHILTEESLESFYKIRQALSMGMVQLEELLQTAY